MKRLILLALLLLTSCVPEHLLIHTEYINEEYLASYHVKTPDPLLQDPPVGQKLIIQWKLPNEYLSYEDLHFHIRIRFRNRQELTQDVPICRDIGVYQYSLLNEEYCKTRGILTYKVDIVGNGCLLREWRHQLWAESIALESTE